MIECAIIKDLLPLYTDEVLSEKSKAIVGEHLLSCESCKSELANMQSEIRKPHQGDEVKIDVLKSMKKKLFRQKVVIAAITGFVVIIIAISMFSLFSPGVHNIPTQHRLEMPWASYVNREFLVDDITTSLLVIDIFSYNVASNVPSTSRLIEINGVETEIMYFYSIETVPSGRMSSNPVRLASNIGVTIVRDNESGMDIVVRNTHPTEVYYLVTPFEGLDILSDADFLALRNDGLLIWSGTLVP
jgi:hypothetical protein